MQDEVVKDTSECVGPLRDIWAILETILIRLNAIERKLQTPDQLQKVVTVISFRKD